MLWYAAAEDHDYFLWPLAEYVMLADVIQLTHAGLEI